MVPDSIDVGAGRRSGDASSGRRALRESVEELALPEPPAPAGDEVLIEVRAAGVGNWDDLVRTGDWNVGGVPPMALGVEAAGIVQAVGPDQAGFSPGDPVVVHSAPIRYQGAWAEWFLAPASHVAAKPADLDWSTAAALPVPALTAIQVVTRLACGSDDDVFVQGAGGVTGGLLVAFAAATGSRVVATCSTARPPESAVTAPARYSTTAHPIGRRRCCALHRDVS